MQHTCLIYFQLDDQIYFYVIFKVFSGVGRRGHVLLDFHAFSSYMMQLMWFSPSTHFVKKNSNSHQPY